MAGPQFCRIGLFPGRTPKRARRRTPLARLEPLELRLLFAFGVTTGSAPTGQPTYVIDNGADLKFSVIQGGSLSSTLHMADISSIQYKGQELLAPYSLTGRYSHYEQGLGAATTITCTVNDAAGWILVTCDDSAESSGGVIQYYAVRRNDNNLYMASLPTDVNNGPGEGRFIAYLSRSVFPNPEAPSDNSGTTGAIEGSDVFGHADGTTTSKFYNMGRRMIDNIYHGVTGSAGGISVGAWMFMGNRETSSGGPFFKDIDFQSSETQVEIYNSLFTGHTQTEPFRQGLKGPYALQFNDGSAPTTPDYSWMDALHLQGWTPASGRGALSGTASGVPAGHDAVVALANSTAQYWTRPDSTGNYTIPGILPGTYTQTLYDTELAVGTKTVTITAGATSSANIVDTFYIPPNPIFRIGIWDGTPAGFLNADKISIMHPSDVRMSSWTSTPNFVIGANTDAQWPMAQFMGVNNSQRITFNLTSAQVQNLTLRIGITWDFSGARPKITVNAGKSYAWTSANPPASADLNSRGITRGTWRGVNQLFTFNIPASSFRAGTNTIDLPMISGSYQAGQTWLSPNVSFDAIDLVPTSAASMPAIASVSLLPANATMSVNGAQAFTAIAKDAAGNVIPANFDFSASLGTIDANGNYIAPSTPGSGTITAVARTTGTPGYLTSSGSYSSFSGTITASGSTSITISAAGGSIHGQAFNDLNADGVLNAGEPPFDGLTIYLDANNNAALDPGEISTTTSDSGAFAFTNIPPGSYVVRQAVSPVGFIASNAPVVTVSNGSSAAVNLPEAQIVFTGTAASDSYTVARNSAGQYGIALNGAPLCTIFAAAPSLTFDLQGGDDTLTLDAGNGMPAPPAGISFDGGTGNDRLVFLGSAGADSASFAAGGANLDGAIIGVTNLEAITFDGRGGWDDLSTTGGPALTLMENQQLQSLALSGSAAAGLDIGATTALLTRNLSIAPAARLDLRTAGLAIDPGSGPSPLGTWDGSAYDGITGMIAEGSLFSSSAIAGLTTLGIAAAADALALAPGATAGWLGQTVAAGAILVRYTYAGDANLDGKINIDDYARIDSNVAKSGSVFGWYNGDFNYDGQINIDDYGVIDSVIGKQPGGS